MVSGKNLNNKYALISLFDKKGLNFLCKILTAYSYSLIATGTTGKKIRRLGYNCIDVSKLTKSNEILDGRIKTLDRKLYGSILYVRDNKKHLNEFKKFKFPQIDIVIINLYPFKQFFDKHNNENILEMIDIGGVSLLRAASKNFRYITTISSKDDYNNLNLNLKKNNGSTDIVFRKKMAGKSFKMTYKYDKVVSEWITGKKNLNNKNILRYGENPNQTAFIKNKKNESIENYKLNGKKISYNNIIDIDSGIKCLTEFNEPTCVILKHTNPCGVASSKSIATAFRKAYQCDKKSAFGGIILLNRNVNEDLAVELSKNFFEIIVAPNFSVKSLKILKTKKNLIILKIDKLKFNKIEYRSTIFGELYQSHNKTKINKNFLKLISNKSANKLDLDDMLFSLKVVKHLKSNAIVLARNKQTIGLGIGQTNRYEALNIAIVKMKGVFKKKTFVCSSDGFFPFTDSIELLKKYGCKSIAQPSGSINDDKLTKYAIKNKLSLYFTKNRLFKH